MSFGYDPEVPAGYQDADLEMAEFEAAASRLTAMRARGICPHTAGIGHRNPSVYSAADLEEILTRSHFGNRGGFHGEQSDIGQGRMLCTDCGELVDDPCDRR